MSEPKPIRLSDPDPEYLNVNVTFQDDGSMMFRSDNDPIFFLNEKEAKKLKSVIIKKHEKEQRIRCSS